MAQPIYIAGGSKGGVGKSMIAIALVDYLLDQGQQVLLIDSDTSNPDVWKPYKDTVQAELINLDEADGWIELVNVCDANPDKVVVVNTAARNNAGVGAYAETLTTTLEELNRELITLWIINRQRDSLELMREYIQAINGELHVLMNGYFGEPHKFQLYNDSKTRKEVEKDGGKSLYFPDLADRVADDLYSNRRTIAGALQDMPLGNRAELKRWKNEAAKVFAEVIK